MKNAVITGATGAIGVALVDKLINENVRVTVICNPASSRNKNIPDDDLVTLVECDISNYNSLKSVLTDKFETFFHFAWQGTSGAGRNNEEMQAKNIEYALEAVKLAQFLGCKVFVGAGSQAEYGRASEKLTAHTPTNPENEYGKAKLIAGNKTRELCKELGIKHIWTRVLSVYGPFDTPNSLISSAINKLKNNENPKYTKGEQIWDYIFSEDAANAFYLIAEYGKNGKTYVIGSGEAKPLSEYIKMIHKAVNSKIQAVFGEVPYGEKQVMYLSADISELHNDTGFSPKTSFEDGIKKTMEELK